MASVDPGSLKNGYLGKVKESLLSLSALRRFAAHSSYMEVVMHG